MIANRALRKLTFSVNRNSHRCISSSINRLYNEKDNTTQTTTNTETTETSEQPSANNDNNSNKEDEIKKCLEQLKQAEAKLKENEKQIADIK
eukprot:Pgem_evm1s11648